MWQSRLRIQRCHCSSLGQSCGMSSIPGPGNSTCYRCRQKEEKNNKKIYGRSLGDWNDSCWKFSLWSQPTEQQYRTNWSHTQTKKSLFCVTDWQSDSVNATILLFFAKLFRPSKQQLSSSFAFPFIYTLESIIDWYPPKKKKKPARILTGLL